MDVPEFGWHAAQWMEHQCAEHLACREGTVLLDTTSFAKVRNEHDALLSFPSFPLRCH